MYVYVSFGFLPHPRKNLLLLRTSRNLFPSLLLATDPSLSLGARLALSGARVRAQHRLGATRPAVFLFYFFLFVSSVFLCFGLSSASFFFFGFFFRPQPHLHRRRWPIYARLGRALSTSRYTYCTLSAPARVLFYEIIFDLWYWTIFFLSKRLLDRSANSVCRGFGRVIEDRFRCSRAVVVPDERAYRSPPGIFRSFALLDRPIAAELRPSSCARRSVTNASVSPATAWISSPRVRSRFSVCCFIDYLLFLSFSLLLFFVAKRVFEFNFFKSSSRRSPMCRQTDKNLAADTCWTCVPDLFLFFRSSLWTHHFRREKRKNFKGDN